MVKTLDEFDRTVSTINPATLDYLATLEWITARENLCLVGPAGTGKSHLLVALGVAAVHAGHRVRYFTAAELVETLYRGLADNSVGRVIDTLLRNDLIICDEVGFAPLDDTGAQLLFRFIAAAYERRALGIASHWPFESWGRFLPEHTTAVSLLDRLLHHANVVVTDGESYRMREARTRQPGGARQTLINPRGGDFYLATSGDRNLAVDRGALLRHPHRPRRRSDGLGCLLRRQNPTATRSTSTSRCRGVRCPRVAVGRGRRSRRGRSKLIRGRGVRRWRTAPTGRLATPEVAGMCCGTYRSTPSTAEKPTHLGHLMAQDEDLDLVGIFRAGVEHHPAQQLREHLVDQLSHGSAMSFTWLATGSRLTRSKNAESRSTAWNSRASAEASSGSPGRDVTAVAVPGQQGSDGDRRLASMAGSFPGERRSSNGPREHFGW